DGEGAAAQGRGEDVVEAVGACVVGPLALPRRVVAEEVELADSAGDEVAGDGVDQEMAEAVAGERGVEAGLEEVVGVVVDEGEVEGEATGAGFEEVTGEAAAGGECVGEGAVAGAQPRVAGDGGAEITLPAGGFEGEAFVEGGVEGGAVDGVGESGAAVDALK